MRFKQSRFHRDVTTATILVNEDFTQSHYANCNINKKIYPDLK